MTPRILALGALTLLTANVANAGTYFDTINISAGSLNGGYDGAANSNLVAQSFYVPPGSPDFTSVTLSLSADNTDDTGSIMVYLVPDDGTGAAGVGGYPQLALDPSNAAATGYDPAAMLLGQVRDSVLPLSSSLAPASITFSVTSAQIAAVSAASTNNEYWIGVAFVGDTSMSGEWWYTKDGSGTGLNGQYLYNTIANALGSTQSLTDLSVGFSYQLTVNTPETVDTPEPATLAILGGGLASLGYVRRRRAVKT